MKKKRVTIIKREEEITSNIQIQKILREELTSMVNNGTILLALHKGKQDKHRENTNNYIEGKSIIEISDKELESYVKENYGKGDLKYSKNKKFNKKETFEFPSIIGYYIDQNTKKEIPTNRGTVHYSKQGFHVIPSKQKNRRKII